MKTHAFGLLLALLSGTAMAAWEQVSEDTETIGYYDPATLVRTGDVVVVAELNDFRRVATTAGDALFRSTRSQREYDCPGARTRLVSVLPFEGRMGEGRARDAMNVDGGWQAIVSGTARADVYNVVCR